MHQRQEPFSQLHISSLYADCVLSQHSYVNKKYDQIPENSAAQVHCCGPLRTRKGRQGPGTGKQKILHCWTLPALGPQVPSMALTTLINPPTASAHILSLIVLPRSPASFPVDALSG